MNILIIDNSNGVTGSFKCALNEAVLLSPNHQVFFIVPENSTNVAEIEKNGFKVFTLPLKEISKSLKAISLYPAYLIRNISNLKKIVQENKIDVVQVNDFYNLLGAGLRMTRVKIQLITYVRFLPTSLPQALNKFWSAIAQRYSHKVIAVSDAVLQQLPQNKNTIRIYDPVVMQEKLERSAAKPEYKQLLYLANFTRGKGQEHALQAFTNAYKINKDLRLKYVGGFLGLEKNKLFKKELEEEAKKLGLEDVIVFKEFDEHVEKLIKESYVLLNFSEAESFSMTCLEASFYGTPVIATKCGGPEEIVSHNETGLLVSKKNIKEMTDAILLLANDEVLRNKFSETARNYVRTKFSEQNFLASFTGVLNE